MELSSQGLKLLLHILIAGSRLLQVSGQLVRPGTGTSATRAPPGPPVRPPGLSPADCGILPTTCTYGTTLPDYDNCRRSYTCGFNNNWQPRNCRAGEQFDASLLRCLPEASATCASCANRTPAPSGAAQCPRLPSSCRSGDANFPDYTNCKRYYSCFRTAYVVQTCRGQSNFDTATRRCQDAAIARCATCNVNPQQPTTPSPLATIRPFPESPRPTLIPPRTRTFEPPTEAPVPPYDPSQWGSDGDEACQLTPKENAPCTISDLKRIPDNLNCSQYYQCVSNRWLVRPCGPGTWFDRNTKECEHMVSAVCQLPCPRKECARPTPCRNLDRVADPSNCALFFVCFNLGVGGAQWHPGDCRREGLPYFDSFSNTCQRNASKCAAPCIPPTVVPQTTTTSAMMSSTTVPPLSGKDITLQLPISEICNAPNRITTADHSSCTPARIRNVHIHPTHCGQIYICSGYRWIPAFCGHGMVWSISDGSCVPNGTAQCMTFDCNPNNVVTTTSTTTASTTTPTLKPTTSTTTTSTPIPSTAATTVTTTTTTMASLTTAAPTTTTAPTPKPTTTTTTTPIPTTTAITQPPSTTTAAPATTTTTLIAISPSTESTTTTSTVAPTTATPTTASPTTAAPTTAVPTTASSTTKAATTASTPGMPSTTSVSAAAPIISDSSSTSTTASTTTSTTTTSTSTTTTPVPTTTTSTTTGTTRGTNSASSTTPTESLSPTITVGSSPVVWWTTPSATPNITTGSQSLSTGSATSTMSSVFSSLTKSTSSLSQFTTPTSTVEKYTTQSATTPLITEPTTSSPPTTEPLTTSTTSSSTSVAPTTIPTTIQTTHTIIRTSNAKTSTVPSTTTSSTTSITASTTIPTTVEPTTVSTSKTTSSVPTTSPPTEPTSPIQTTVHTTSPTAEPTSPIQTTVTMTSPKTKPSSPIQTKVATTSPTTEPTSPIQTTDPPPTAHVPVVTNQTEKNPSQSTISISEITSSLGTPVVSSTTTANKITSTVVSSSTSNVPNITKTSTTKVTSAPIGSTSIGSTISTSIKPSTTASTSMLTSETPTKSLPSSSTAKSAKITTVFSTTSPTISTARTTLGSTVLASSSPSTQNATNTIVMESTTTLSSTESTSAIPTATTEGIGPLIIFEVSLTLCVLLAILLSQWIFALPRYTEEVSKANVKEKRVLMMQISENLEVTGTLPTICPAERGPLTYWQPIPMGENSRGNCPPPQTGYTVRRCVFVDGVGAMWDKPDHGLCVDALYKLVLEEAEELKQASPPGPPGTPPVVVNQVKLSRTIMGLSKLTTQDVRQPGGIQPGNLNASVEAVAAITRLTGDQNVNLTLMETHALFKTADNFLNTRNKQAWESILEQDPSRGVTVMAAVDEIGRQMAHTADGGNTVTTRSSSLAIRAEIRPKDEAVTFDYTPDPPPWSTPDPTGAGLRDRVILDKETLEHLSEDLPGDMIAVWSTYFYTINDVLPVKGDDFLNSRVMSVSVQGLRSGRVLKPPVRLIFTTLNNTVKDAVTKCSFWKFGVLNRGDWSEEGCRIVSSDPNGVVCECDHLTNFAILLSPSPAAGMHKTILDIISVIGCLLSILGMLITICLYILSWKRVKSHHAVVLINLCIALIIANTTFLAGIERTQDKLICTVIAGMLHFFYLVAFFMMFADGVQFILYVVQVFHVRRKRETFLLLLTCWIIPAVIVAITMSITRTEGYGTEDYCWLKKDTGLIAAFAVPAIIVMIANFVVLCKILHTISNSKGSERNNRVKATIWNIAVMMPLLGLTWVFALFAVNDQLIVFQYLFCVCNSLQGFFIFFFHCALNKKMRQAVAERFSTRSSMSSSMRKSGGSNKSDKKDKKANKKSSPAKKNKNSKKPDISPPKPMGRPIEYISPRINENPLPVDQTILPPPPNDDNPPMEHPTGVPVPPPLPPPPPPLEPQYMDLEEVQEQVQDREIQGIQAKPSPMMGRRLEAQYPTGFRPHSRGGDQPPPGYGSAERKLYGRGRGLPRYDQQQQAYYSSLERQQRQYGYNNMSPDMRYRRDRDMEQIDLNFTRNENSLGRNAAGGGHGGGYGIVYSPNESRDWDSSTELHPNQAINNNNQPQQPRHWYYGGPHTNNSFKYGSMSMDDLRMCGEPDVSRHHYNHHHHHTQQQEVDESFPPPPDFVLDAAAAEDPYLSPQSSHDDMALQMNPLRQAQTFDPRRPVRAGGGGRSPYMKRGQRLGSHSRSLDRLDRLRGSPPARFHQRNQQAISADSMRRFVSKDKGGAFILLEPSQIYENLAFEGGLKGHTTEEEPVYMQIDDVTQVDSQMSGLDYMAGRA